MKTALILGAGRVSAPCVDYLVRKGGCKVAVCDISEDNLVALGDLFPSVETVREDLHDYGAALIDRYKPGVVANLLPPAMMPDVSKVCLEKKVNMVHPAYLDDATKDLADAIAKAGLVFIVELGLDPGIDHMSAAKTITKIHEKGCKVESFRSLCGALPAPDANTNPWGYKLSWSPSSLIGASKRTARTLQDGHEVIWPDGETYEHVYMYEVPGVADFEAYANADSVAYREGYSIPEARDIYRGTLRYTGWCETIVLMNRIGFFETDEQDTKGLTFAAFTARQAGGGGDPKTALCERLGVEAWSAFILKMEWLGFFDDRPLPFERASAREVLSLLFAEKLVFKPNERDLIVLCDEIVMLLPDGKRKKHTSLLVDYGIPGKWSSIARTTGVPPAIAARFILDGRIGTPGLHMPMSKDIYEPVLEELASEGIVLEETMTDL